MTEKYRLQGTSFQRSSKNPPSVLKRYRSMITEKSIMLAKKSTISINDALAIIIMEQQGIDEIYTFDRHFSQAKVRIVQE
jgi:predicted nucleic acid-binding protein